MDKEEAIKYLERKGKIQTKTDEETYSKEHEELIEKVVKEGKIFGDPLVELG